VLERADKRRGDCAEALDHACLHLGNLRSARTKKGREKIGRKEKSKEGFVLRRRKSKRGGKECDKGTGVRITRLITSAGGKKGNWEKERNKQGGGVEGIHSEE